MRRTVSNLLIVGLQVLIVGLFFVTVFGNEVNIAKHVSTIHNENLNKIATSVSILFEEEEVTDEMEDFSLEELPSATIEEEVVDVDKEVKNDFAPVKEEVKSTPLYSIDASKYSDNVSNGFKVTEGNKEYDVTGKEFDVVVAVIASEFDKNLNDALAVVSVILNRCDSSEWVRWAGSGPYKQVIMKNQFEVYFKGMYLDYMPGGSKYGSEKYNVAKQALIDGLNGIRNNKYTGFRAWWVTSYSDKYIVTGGNRYGYK